MNLVFEFEYLDHKILIFNDSQDKRIIFFCCIRKYMYHGIATFFIKPSVFF